MKKIHVALILVGIIVGLVVGLKYMSLYSDEGSSIANSQWEIYSDDSYTVEYPAEFPLQQSPDRRIKTFENKDITKEGQPAFVSIELLENPNRLSIEAWWKLQLDSGDRALSDKQHAEIGNVGGRQTLVITPSEFGSTNYIFTVDDKIVSIHGFLAERYIDRIIASFKLN